MSIPHAQAAFELQLGALLIVQAHMLLTKTAGSLKTNHGEKHRGSDPLCCCSLNALQVETMYSDDPVKHQRLLKKLIRTLKRNLADSYHVMDMLQRVMVKGHDLTGGYVCC